MWCGGLSEVGLQEVLNFSGVKILDSRTLCEAEEHWRDRGRGAVRTVGFPELTDPCVYVWG